LIAHRSIRKGGRANLTDLPLQSLILLPTYCALRSTGNVIKI